jgi:hypothetical protein
MATGVNNLRATKVIPRFTQIISVPGKDGRGWVHGLDDRGRVWMMIMSKSAVNGQLTMTWRLPVHRFEEDR